MTTSGGTREYPLHRCVFSGNVAELSRLIRSGEDVGLQDAHGNTALHLAVMLGHKECVHLLVAHGAPVKVKNRLGWSPLAEAISFGDRQTISVLLRKLKIQSKDEMKSRKPDIIAAMRAMGDYIVDLKWDFTSWVPLISKVLPSDLCIISKRGSSIRLDTTLLDFTEMRWERGDITFLYKGDSKDPEDSFLVLDNKAKVYQRARFKETEVEFEHEVDLHMSSDIVSAQISTKPINFSKAQSGWFFKEDRSELVGNYRANFYTVNGMSLETRKRREHLSSEDLQKNRAILENFTKANGQIPDLNNDYRESLTPPKKSGVTWEEYIESNPTEYPNLGRPHVCKESSKGFKATVAMSEDFPLTVDMLLNVLEIIAPQFKHFQKLRDFVEMKLPPGFPVKVDVPVLPMVSARVTFQDFRWEDSLDPKLFEIPPDYVEDPARFPDL